MSEDAMDITKVGSVVVALAFMAGVLYDYGYFLGLGLSFFTFLTFKDHLTALVSFAGQGLLLMVIIGGLRGTKGTKRQKVIDGIAVAWIAVVIYLWTAKDELAIIPRASGYAFWFRGFSSFILIAYLIAVILEFFASGKLSEKTGPQMGLIGMAALVLMALLVMFGSYSYWGDVAGNQFETELTITSDDKAASDAATVPQAAHLVRAIDEGMFVVFKEVPGRIVFVRKDAVKTLSRNVRK